MKKLAFAFICIALTLSSNIFAQTVPYSIGHIVVSSEGNEHDHDDWAATSFTLALLAPESMFNWINTSPIRNTSEEAKKQLDWLYQRQLTCVKKGDFDPSDAGMIIYLLTGKQKTSPEDAKAIIENPVH